MHQAELVASQDDVSGIAGGWNFYYTDESKIEVRVGAAISACNEEEEIFHSGCRLKNQYTVFEGKIVAIYGATKLILKKKRPANILSDSRLAFQTISDPETLNPVTTMN